MPTPDQPVSASEGAMPRRPVEIVNVPDVTVADDDFTHMAEVTREISWRRLTGLPINAIERRVQFIRLSRYRAALQAAGGLGRRELVVSHLPRMTAATAAAMRLFGKDNPHLGFSFNFTDLPEGRGLAYMRSVFRTVDRFAVYSNYEQRRYPELFDIPADRFKSVVWTQSVPPVEPGFPGMVDGDYFCAVGAEGRDFDLLLEVAARLPKSFKIVVIARPASLAGRSLPDNLVFLTAIPLARTWAIAERSLGVLIPLKSPETCCGHITFVSAKQLGIPVAATRSAATVEYTEDRPGIIECDARDPIAFGQLLERLADERTALRAGARERVDAERALHHRSKWAAFLSEFIAAHGQGR